MPVVSRLGAFLRSRPGRLAGLVAVTAVGIAGTALLPQPVGGGVVLVAVLAMVFGIAHAQGSTLGTLGLGRPASWRRTLGLAVLWSVTAFVLFRLVLEGVLERWTGVERDLSRFAYLEGDEGALLRLLPVLWLTAAFFEEVFFRGFLIPQIAALFARRRLGLAVGVAISSFLFAALHSYQAMSGVLLTLAGAFFLASIFVAHRQNLWIPMLVHGLFDTSGALLVYLGAYERVTRWLF